MLDLKFFNKVYKEVIPMFRDYIFDIKSGGKNAKDVYGKSYKQYTNLYSQRKKLGKIKRQEGKFKGSNAPVATGDLYKDFQKISVSNKGFSFGTVAHGGKVEGLNKMGRKLSTSSTPIPEDVQEFIEVFAVGYTDKRFRKEFRGGKFDLNL